MHLKKLLVPAAVTLLLLSCNNDADKGKFTLDGELKGAADQKVYLEELFFSDKSPQVLDTGDIANGKFSVTTIAAEEGMYRIRLEKDKIAYLFTNDGNKISLSADINNPELSGWQVSGDANASLKKILMHGDTANTAINATYSTMMRLQQSNVLPTDSVLVALNAQFNTQKEELARYCFQYADTAKNPIIALFAATMAPVDAAKFQIPVEKLGQRFPKHNGIASSVSFIKTQVARQLQPDQPQPAAGGKVGSMAPDITMNDVNGKPFSLSQLKGKYVLVDFWASWCGPCRMENPAVVAAYNKFKTKNFTVLGVSLDDNKEAWVKAIAADKLEWQQISDLKKWRSAAIDPYGIESIPYNVLVDPSGKIIAEGLRGEALEAKLAEVIK